MNEAGVSASDYAAVEFLRAQYRRVARERAVLMSAIVAVLDCYDDDPDTGGLAEFAVDEVRAALVWTRRAAEAQCGLAVDVLRRLPLVHAAMLAGELDEPRARIFAEWTGGLTDVQTAAVCAALLPQAAQWTTGQLIERIKRWAIAVDPDWARRRYQQAVAGRRIVGSRNPDGTANLCGYDLPVQQVAAACARIDALARAAKHAGHPDPIDHIRADLFLGMADGSYTGLDDAAILATLTAGLPAPDSDVPAPVSRPVDDMPAATGAGAVPDTPPATADGGGAAGRRGGRYRDRGVEVRVKLSTLLGYDQHPGDLAGWGPIHADLARTLVARHTGGTWRYVTTTSDGHLDHTGVLRRRPTGMPRTGHGTVEIQIDPATMATLADLPTDHPWTPVLAEITPPADTSNTDDPRRRSPRAGLRRLVGLRNRTCVFPGCRIPARHSDLDHTHDHAHGGPTVEANLGPVCRHDHRVKHHGGWRLHQPRPGHFTWTSPLGHTYQVPPSVIIEALPDPIDPRPHHDPLWTRSDHGWQTSHLLPPPPPTPEPARPPPPPPDDDLPPF